MYYETCRIVLYNLLTPYASPRWQCADTLTSLEPRRLYYLISSSALGCRILPTTQFLEQNTMWALDIEHNSEIRGRWEDNKTSSWGMELDWLVIPSDEIRLVRTFTRLTVQYLTQAILVSTLSLQLLNTFTTR